MTYGLNLFGVYAVWLCVVVTLYQATRARMVVELSLRHGSPVRQADLPIDQPTRFTLVINRKIAEALGVTHELIG